MAEHGRHTPMGSGLESKFAAAGQSPPTDRLELSLLPDHGQCENDSTLDQREAAIDDQVLCIHKLLSSDARNKTAFAISSGSPVLPDGVFVAECAAYAHENKELKGAGESRMLNLLDEH
jgi:hypothetical protein